MSRKDHVPTKGDAVWVEAFFLDKDRWGYVNRQPNGFIMKVDWREREVIVRFYDGQSESYSFDDLEGHYEPCFGGLYMI